MILLGLAFAAGAAESENQGKAPKKAPKECFPILRMPRSDPTPPGGPIPYSSWYYVLYEPFCQGKSADKCIWACGRVPSKRGSDKKSDD
jgi:hypothetical protein